MTPVYSVATKRLFPSHFLLLGALLFFINGAFAVPLPGAVTSALKDAGIPVQNVSIVVRDVEGNAPVISHNAREPMNPASVMKLLTTYAALEILGPAYTWKTEALTDSRPSEGRLAGNLYLRGSGDPRLVLEQFWLFLRQLRARGIRDIQGDLVLDRSAFSLPPHDPSAFDNEPLRPYNAGPDALLINLKSLTVTLHPESDKGRIVVLHETPGAERWVTNRLALSNESCGDWREKLKIQRSDDTIVLEGSFPATCGDKALSLSPWTADLQVDRLFRALWQELGGTLTGVVRAGQTPANAVVLGSNESPALGEIIREINKFSNNVMARQVFLTLDATRPATPEGAQRRIRTWLGENRLAMPELVLENGAGLSRKERISADSLARLLLTAWQSPVMPELMASLPLAGLDGTLKKRLGNTPTTGRAHLKTGYLENVRALAGFAQDSAGGRWIVVFMINDAKSRQGKPAMDALLQWITEQGATKK